MTPPLELEDAQARLLELVKPVGQTATLPLEDCTGHFLASDLVATRTQPPSDLSAMDGYATCGAGPWRLVGESRGGAPFDGKLAQGEATRISTGAWMPEGADAVLIQEEASLERETLSAASDAPTARYIRRAGLDFAEGQTVLTANERLGAAQIALALASGATTLTVRDRPRLAIIETGDELARGDPKDPAQIPASNGAMLAAMADTLPTVVQHIGPVADDQSAIEQALTHVSNSDLIVLSGGASVGPHDLVKPALEAAGYTLDFWRVAMKPGKPLMVATKADQIVLGLPGNPVSSYVTAFLFMLPAVRRLCGASLCLPLAINLPLAEALPTGGKRREFLRARWTENGVIPAAQQDSSALLPLAHAQVLIDRPAQAEPVAAGAFVPAYLLENSLHSGAFA